MIAGGVPESLSEEAGGEDGVGKSADDQQRPPERPGMSRVNGQRIASLCMGDREGRIEWCVSLKHRATKAG